MDLKGILTVSGKPGLYQLVGQMNNGIIIESLTDGKRMPAYASHKVSALEDISIYTETEEVPLGEIMDNIHAYVTGGGEIDASPKNDRVKELMSIALPDYDRERVYVSDMKKLFKWYLALEKAGLMVPSEEETEETPVVEDAEVVEEAPTTTETKEGEE